MHGKLENVTQEFYDERNINKIHVKKRIPLTVLIPRNAYYVYICHLICSLCVSVINHICHQIITFHF